MEQKIAGSLFAFLERILDYAGMFPPAGLPLEEALQNYLEYQKQPESFLLGKFICPVSKLEELKASLGRPQSPVGLSFTATKSTDILSGLYSDLESLRQQKAPCYSFDILELPLPVDFANQLTSKFGNQLKEANALVSRIFLEIPSSGDLESNTSQLLEFLTHYPESGVKIRCGGPKLTDVPAPEKVVNVLGSCAGANVPLKATAGLHHPFCSWENSQAQRHGFVNLFAAGILASNHQITEQTLLEILTDNDPNHFHFEGTAFRWGDLSVSMAQIRAARQARITSFGSCSFSEPIADLHALNWLE